MIIRRTEAAPGPGRIEPYRGGRGEPAPITSKQFVSEGSDKIVQTRISRPSQNIKSMSGKKIRVVVTGMGVLAPNAHGVAEFVTALQTGASGIRFQPRLAELGFCCQIGGIPQGIDEIAARYFEPMMLKRMDPHCVMGCIAALDAWADAGFVRDPAAPVDWDTESSSALGWERWRQWAKRWRPLPTAGESGVLEARWWKRLWAAPSVLNLLAC